MLLFMLILPKFLIKQNLYNIRPDKRLTKSKRRYFTGPASLTDLTKIISIKQHKIYNVLFKNVSRTKLHYHQGDQSLIVTGGRGRLVTYTRISGNMKKKLKIKKKEDLPLSKGDIVFIQAGRLHWHGCIGSKDFSHLAINLATSRGKEAKTVWYESDYKTFAKRMN